MDNQTTPTLRKTRRGWESEQEDPRQPLLVSQAEAARLLGICLRTLGYLVANKEIAAVRIGKQTLVRYSSLLSFVRRDHASPSKCNVEVQ